MYIEIAKRTNTHCVVQYNPKHGPALPSSHQPYYLDILISSLQNEEVSLDPVCPRQILSCLRTLHLTKEGKRLIPREERISEQ